MGDNFGANHDRFCDSVIACGCEAGIEMELPPFETPDGRPSGSVMIFATGRKALAKHLATRVGQSVSGSGIESVMAIVIDGLIESAINHAIRIGIEAIVTPGTGNGVRRAMAGNYGEKLGSDHFHLREIMSS